MRLSRYILIRCMYIYATSNVGITKSTFSDDVSYHTYMGNVNSADDVANINEDWISRGQQDIEEALNIWPKWKAAKNVIFIVGDGMGLSTQTASRFFKAQTKVTHIPDTRLSWEAFPTVGTIRTYNTDQITPDSAGTATAFLCGTKTRAFVAGLNHKVPFGNCTMSKGNEVRSLINYGIDEGKWTGIVTTTRITHATPAPAYAHAANRRWECDADIPETAYEEGETCRDIAWQLVHGEQNDEIRVLLGGGRRNFRPNTTADPEYPDENNSRGDGLDLIQDWLDIHKDKGLTDEEYRYVENLTDFNSVDPSQIQYLFGMFEDSHMQFEVDRPNDKWGEPSLTEMVDKALDILKKGPNGYFLFIEGGRIDHGHHFNRAHRALTETLSLDEAVQLAIDKTSAEDTLMVITSDHSHPFRIVGYQSIDSDILGVAQQNGELSIANDNKPYLSLSYGTGLGFREHRTENGDLQNEIPRKNLTGVVTNGTDFAQDAAVPFVLGHHGGEDVAVYARGPMSHLFTGLHEQSYIAHAIGYAACLGWNKEMCVNPRPPPTTEPDTSGARLIHADIYLVILVVTYITWT